MEDISERIVSVENRVSISKITKFERASIIGFRAEQLANNARPLLDEIPESIAYDPIKIAEEEFRLGLIKVTIERPIERGGMIYYEHVTIGGNESELYIYN